MFMLTEKVSSAIRSTYFQIMMTSTHIIDKALSEEHNDLFCILVVICIMLHCD